jgi:hypothetical protein
MLRPVFVVWGLWTAMLVLALLYVSRYGVNAPYYDEWISMIAVLEGTREVDPAWLWTAHNDHRIPLPKLVLLGLYAVSGWDFRTPMFASVLLCAGAAALVMRSAAQSRGRTSHADVFFPLILLSWGHYENFLWGWQLTQVVPVVLVLAILATMVRTGLRPGAASGLACGVIVVALPLCGVPGLVYAPALTGWLVFVGGLQWKAGARGGRPLALALWICAVLAVALVPLYFLGLTTSVRGAPSPVATVGTMVAFLAQGFGPAASASRPVSYLVVFAIGLSGFVALLLAFRRRETASRERVLAFLFFLAGFGALALSVGVARPGLGTFPPRYFLQAAPALVWIYFAWDVSGRPRTAALVRACLVGAALVAVGPNYVAGLDYARMRADRWDAFAADVRRGLPPSALVARHQRTLLPYPEAGGAYWHAELARGLETLRRAEVGIFADLAREGPLREVPIAALAAAEADGPATLWRFDPPVKLIGLRLLPPRPLAGEEVTAYVTLAWTPAAAEFTPERRYYHWWNKGEPEARVWIDDDVAALRAEIEHPGDALGPPTIVLLLRDGTSRSSP